MRTIKTTELSQNPSLLEDLVEVLRQDGVVCLPVANHYRLVTNLLSEKAVIKFMQIKRRTKKAPVLAFVPNRSGLETLVTGITEQSEQLMNQFWPGPLTLAFDMNPELPKKIRKNIGYKGQIGVRIPQDQLITQLIEAFDGPLLISSANPAKKKGAHSEAQVRKNFARWMDIFVSEGDLKGDLKSTVVDATVYPPKLKRAGDLDFELILNSTQLPSIPHSHEELLSYA